MPSKVREDNPRVWEIWGDVHLVELPLALSDPPQQLLPLRLPLGV